MDNTNEVTPPSPEPPTQLEEIRAAAKSGDWATVIQLFRRKRTDDYRSGYSCGYSDAKNGKPMRDADAASAFYGEWKKNVTISRDKPTATEPVVSQGQASPEPPTKLKMGFHVEIEMHNQESATTLNPEEIKTIIGAAFDKTGMFLEGVDFSLEVKRTYEQV